MRVRIFHYVYIYIYLLCYHMWLVLYGMSLFSHIVQYVSEYAQFTPILCVLICAKIYLVKERRILFMKFIGIVFGIAITIGCIAVIAVNGVSIVKTLIEKKKKKSSTVVDVKSNDINTTNDDRKEK